jgi:hypothetical protein
MSSLSSGGLYLPGAWRGQVGLAVNDLLRSVTETGLRRAAAFLILGLSVVSYFIVLPFGWTSKTPLPWDPSVHYLQATQFADGLKHFDWTTLRPSLRGRDSYPPGHSIALGTWLALFGKDVSSWFAFGLLVFVGTTALLLRIGLVAALTFVVSPLLVGYAPTIMLEPLVGLFLVLTIVLFPQSRGERLPTWRFVAFGVAATATVLTKYNVGLPIIPAAVIGALLTRNRRQIVGTSIAALIALGAWAGFLTWQDDGWNAFAKFAENISNSAGASPLDRAAWYSGVFATMFTGSILLGIVVGGLAIVGGFWILIREKPWATGLRSSRLAFALAYVISSVTAYAMHDYLLSRNFFGPALAMLAAAGIVVEGLPIRIRWASVGLVAVLGLSVAFSTQEPTRTAFVERYFYPPRNQQLEKLSESVIANLEDGVRTKAVGTFAQFSPDWVFLLRDQHAPGVFVSVDSPFPLEPSRTHASDEWSQKYSEIVERWYQAGFERIVGIKVEDGSPFDNVGYQTWQRWKTNYIRAAMESPKFRLATKQAMPGGITFYVFDAKHDN